MIVPFGMFGRDVGRARKGDDTASDSDESWLSHLLARERLSKLTHSAAVPRLLRGERE